MTRPGANEGRLEHANLTVTSLDDTVAFLTTAIPTFRVRGQGIGPNGLRWLHVGTGETYLALTEAGADADTRWRGLNHLGFEVGDAEALHRRLEAAGYREGYVPEPHPHRRRVYFHDADGNEWEFVEYFSGDPAERNDYSR